MIIQEIVTLYNKEFKHTYSDEGKYIKQIETGNIYDEAYDLIKINYSYEETDVVIQE